MLRQGLPVGFSQEFFCEIGKKHHKFPLSDNLLRSKADIRGITAFWRIPGMLLLGRSSEPISNDLRRLTDLSAMAKCSSQGCFLYETWILYKNKAECNEGADEKWMQHRNEVSA